MKGPGRKKHGTKKVLGLVMVVGIIAAGTYAFTNSNTVPANNAGDGAAAVSGYTVSSLDYNENTTDPSTIDSVDFQLSGAADRVRVQLSDGTNGGDDSWFDCTTDASAAGILGLVSGGTAWTCSTSGYAAVDVNNFRVLGYDDNNTVLSL